jgi:hypothetical protein
LSSAIPARHRRLGPQRHRRVLDTGAGAENGCEFDCRNGFAHPANKFADTIGITIKTARNQINRVFEKIELTIIGN